MLFFRTVRCYLSVLNLISGCQWYVRDSSHLSSSYSFFFESSNSWKQLWLGSTGKAGENGQYSYRKANFDWTRPWDVTPGDRRSEWVNQALITFPIDSVPRRFCLNWATIGNDNQTKLDVESGFCKTSTYRWWAELPVIMVTEKVTVGSRETKECDSIF